MCKLHSFEFNGFESVPQVLAYGQTGAGKTYTMGTNATLREVVNRPVGMIPCVINSIFEYIEAASSTFDIVLKVTTHSCLLRLVLLVFLAGSNGLSGPARETSCTRSLT